MVWLLLIVLNLPIFHVLVCYVFWEDWGGLWRAIVFLFTPNVLSAFRGEFYEDWWEELKLALFLASATCLILAERELLLPLLKG